MDDVWTGYLDESANEALLRRALQSPRGRLNFNLHPQLADPIQRLLNAGEKGTYVRPHRHDADRWELVMTLRGYIDALVFDEEGRITRRLPLKAGGAGIIQNRGGVWHSFVFLEHSVAFELKPGPYDAATDKEFAPWSPREDGPDAAAFARWMATAAIGARWDGARS